MQHPRERGGMWQRGPFAKEENSPREPQERACAAMIAYGIETKRSTRARGWGGNCAHTGACVADTLVKKANKIS